MYKIQTTADETMILENGSEAVPVTTLTDKYGGKAQIFNDDHCYVLALLQQNGKYKPTEWWFREAIQAVQELSLPR